MDLVTINFSNNILTFYLNGRIDSVNSPTAEEIINSELKKNNAQTVIVDAKNLEYISSAGLRVLLRLKKNKPLLKIINVSSDVYEIFEMTGFTEIIDISKSFREFSVDGCEIIGKGANGEVYRIDSDTIIKVYFNPDALPDIERERQLARRAFVLGIPTAIPYDVVKVGESYGSVFELLNAECFTQLLNNDSANIDNVARMYVELLKKIHSTDVLPDEMPDMKQNALGWVDYIKDYIAPDKWDKLHKLVSDIPESHKMIHGDFHTKNIMIQNGEVLLIDMDTLSQGNAIFEFAQIYNDFVGFYDYNPCDGLNFIGLSDSVSKEFYNKALSLYFNTTDENKLEEIKNKSRLIGYLRLLRRAIRRNKGDIEELNKEIEFYKNNIESIVDNIDSLAL